MAHPISMTMQLKQDAASKRALKEFKQTFATRWQPRIDEAMRASRIIHFARVVTIEDKYLQLLTEFDGDRRVYTTFFLNALPDVFEAMFALAKGAPPWQELRHPDKFFEYCGTLDLPPLGKAADGSGDGFLFAAYGAKEVKEILPLLA